MNRTRPSPNVPKRRPIGLPSFRSTGAAALACCAFLGVSAALAAPPPLRIAVAPFQVGSESQVTEQSPSAANNAAGNAAGYGLPIAKVLSGQLARRNLERLITPDAFIADAVYEPNAEEVRRWAYNAAVDAVVVGRITRMPAQRNASSDKDRRQVEVIVRSGHSGAELARHDLVIEGTEGLAMALDPLAVAILRDLGYEEPAVASQSPNKGTPAVSANVDSENPDAGTRGSSGRGLDAAFDLPGFRSDAPIEIQADEAEIINRGDERKLIFQRNVRVRQANVLLRSDRLEAEYRKGESEPRKLVAHGRVQVAQGDRRASCDHAVYLREAEQLTCRGHAELIQGCDIVRGESIEFDLAGDQARVEGAASIVIRPEGGDGEGSGVPCDLPEGSM